MTEIRQKKSSILIVDDMPKNIQIAASILRDHGYQVAFDTDGKSALLHTKSVKFDLILLDIMMPDTDGYEVCRLLKENPETKEIPVIFLTAKTDTESIVKGFQLGSADYIVKPFNAEELLARVKTHLEAKHNREELKQANIRLKELNAAKDKFFSIVAHDLRSPFNSLIEGFDLLTGYFETLSEEEKKAHLDTMKTTCNNTLNLLDNLLTWSRSQIGRLDCNPIMFHIRNIVNETIFLLNKNASNKNVSLNSLIRDDTTVFADMNMITTVIRNLLSNAIKYTPEGGSIAIEDKDRGNAWEISVSDTGVGMTSEDMEKVFRIDMRYSTPGTANEQGTGLGLNLCKEFVEKNGGMIGVESRVGKGSRFYFTLPKPIRGISSDYDISDLSEIIPPSREDLERLIDFSRLGDIGAIRQEADNMIRNDKHLMPFAKELRRLAGKFQISKIRTFLLSFERPEVRIRS